MAFDPGQLFNFYQRLSPRERLLLVLAVGSVLSISLYSFVWDPLVTGREALHRRIAAKEKELVEIQTHRTRYLDLQRQLEAGQAVLVHTEKGFGLLTHLQNAVGQVISGDHIQSMNPTEKNFTDEYQEQAVEIKLTAVSLEQLTNLLYRIEKGDPQLRVSRMQVKKRYNDPYNFDVTATVSLLKPRGTGSSAAPAAVEAPAGAEAPAAEPPAPAAANAPAAVAPAAGTSASAASAGPAPVSNAPVPVAPAGVAPPAAEKPAAPAAPPAVDPPKDGSK